MDILEEELDDRTPRSIKTEKSYLQEVYVDPKIEMDGEEGANPGRWEVVEVIQDMNSARSLHPDILCADALNSQDKVNADDPPAITDGATVTYRVVQLSGDVSREGEVSPQIVTTTGTLVSGQPVTQAALIANPFASAANGGASPGAEGPFYVMMSPQEVLGGQRTLAPRTHTFSPKAEGARTARDERRRATHNEVERRRRDKINNWIVKLSKIVPDCTSDHSKQGQGGILAKACDYIQELRAAGARLPDVLKENERLNLDLDLLRQQCEELKNENQVLRAHLQQQGEGNS